MIGVIPAAGRGTRAYPYTQGIPKGMVDVAGRPSLERVVLIMRDKLGLTRIVIIVGTFHERIREHFGDGARFGVSITYVQNDAVDRGLGYSLLLARPYVNEHCVVMLSDECYVDSNHEDLLLTDYRSFIATCAVQDTDDERLIRRNYAVYAERGLVRRIVEKPRRPRRAQLGLGTFVFSRDFFAHLDAAVAAGEGPSDPVSVLGRLCERGARVASFPMRGLYVNINDRNALHLAGVVLRSKDLDGSTIGLALVMKGAEDDTLRAIREFRATGRFHEIVLVTGPGGLAPALLDGVRQVQAASTRYGDLMRAGLDALTTDVLACALSDGSCRARDIFKFLEYLKEADMVVGTRTTRQLIEQGTHMRGVVRLTHIVLAKVLGLVWWGYEPRFTDVGCTYRTIWRSAYLPIRNRLSTSGPEYSVEMFLELLKSRRRVLEIPVNFSVRREGPREPDQRIWTFVAILLLTIRRRFSA